MECHTRVGISVGDFFGFFLDELTADVHFLLGQLLASESLHFAGVHCVLFSNQFCFGMKVMMLNNDEKERRSDHLLVT